MGYAKLSVTIPPHKRDVIPNSIKLIAGRTGQEFKQRKGRKGAFWEDRYHATAVEGREHLFRCLVYIDLDMVKTGVVMHPSEWPFCGYNEIQEPKRKNVLIDYQRLTELLGSDTYDQVKIYHLKHASVLFAEDTRQQARRRIAYFKRLITQ